MFGLRTVTDGDSPDDAEAQDAIAGSHPFIMQADGKGWLYAPSGMLDGPLPTHYEPVESPVANSLYKQQTSPVYKHWKNAGNDLAFVEGEEARELLKRSLQRPRAFYRRDIPVPLIAINQQAVR